MKRFYCIGFLCLMACDTLAQISFKYAGMDAAPLECSFAWILRVLASPWAYGALGGYLGSFVTWITILRYAPVGPAFAASHLELISATAFSVWLFHEPLGFCKVAGGLLIILGVICLAKSEDADAAKDGHIAAQNAHKA
ncbi:MAG: EamA family transporter [Deltaproteobacteria bacterium]|jgi:drug/metabolite transporter (DMT)-like permease|nr:EamA family transporter [Deltaproteobacteria bacterium]